jgi:hypothetical protein
MSLDEQLVVEESLPEVRLAIAIEPPDSETITIGPDELEADRTLTSISYQTELPGGFGPGDFTVPHPPGAPQPKTWLLGGVRVYDADTDQTYYEGRITNVSSDTESATTSIETEGWAKHMSDDTTAREIFIDSDISKWGEPSIDRRIEVLSVNYLWTTAVSAGLQGVSGTTGVGLLFSFTTKSAGFNCIGESWYYGDGVSIGTIMADFKALGAGEDTRFVDQLGLMDKDSIAGGGFDLGKDLNQVSTTKTELKTAASTRKYALITGEFIEPGSAFTFTNNDRAWLNIKVIGQHGLTVRGTWPNVGFFVSDMAPYAIGRWAPLLSYTTGPEGSIETTTFAVPHSVFTDEGTVTAMLEAWSLFGGQTDEPLQWGVYEDKRVFLCQAKRFGRVWRVRQDQTAKSQEQGADASERINGVRIVYDRGDGRPRSVGPVGSQSTIETDDLIDTNPANPANADGSRHWVTYNAGTMNDEQAKLVAGLILMKSTEERWRGSITIEGWGYDESGAPIAAGLARAGDWVVVEDDDDGDTALRQMRNTSFDGGSKVANCSVGAPPDELSVLLAKAGVALQGNSQ